MATTTLSSIDDGPFISSPGNGPVELDFPLFLAHIKKPKPQVVRDWPLGVGPNATVKVPHYEAVKTRKMSTRAESKAKGSDNAIVPVAPHPSKERELLDSETSGNVIPDENVKVLESKRRAKIRGLTEINLEGFRKESKTIPLWGGMALKKDTSELTRSGRKDWEEETLLPVRTLNRESRRKRGSRRRKEGPIETPSKRSVGLEPKKERLINSVKELENLNKPSNSSLVVARNRRSLRICLRKEGGRAKRTELLRVGIGMAKLASTQGMKKRKGFALSGPAKMNTRSRRNSFMSCKSGDPRKNLFYALRTYDALRRYLLQKDEMMEAKEVSKVRADLRAGSFLTKKGFRTEHGGKILGSVPGIEVGDHFFFRMELSLVGMHGPIQAGIGYLTGKETEWNTPVAISIISFSGQDEDDGTGWELLYTGQGGKSATESQGNEDQKLERGNLALDGSMQHRTPVRVIRGIRDSNSPSGRIYTYDGLYTVDSRCSVKGKGGFEEFKFKLSRIIGQPDLGSALLKLSTEFCRTPYSRENICVRDISKGRESLPVCVYNDVDDEGGLPPPFDYSTDIKYPTRGKHERLAAGCECTGTCTFDQNCACLRRNRNMFAYLTNGVLVKERGCVYECGSHCKCGSRCRNRVTQRGIKHHFEIFKKAGGDDGSQEWGVRSWDSIAAGTFLCEYTGDILHGLESTELSKAKRFSLNLRLLPKRSPPWGDVSTVLGGRPPSNVEDGVWEYPAMSIDSSESGNLSRFIAHSSFPNVLIQCVLREREHSKFPHAMLFAMDNIPPFKELTIDYGL